ncbi:MAG: hypothetical protein AAB599_02305 [Patescibacteria group bacterium]
MKKFFQIHDVGIKEILIIGLILLAGYTIWIHKTLVPGAYQKVAQVVDRIPGVNILDRCGQECQEEIDKKVAEALATVSAKQSGSTVGGGSGTTKTTYVPIGSTFSTRSLDWTDVPGQVEVDTDAYGSSPAFYWDGSVKIGNSNGEVFVRLFDVTNGIAVSLSELSANSANYTNVSSQPLPLWAGKNTYKVQIKSTSGEEATIASDRVKIIYK